MSGDERESSREGEGGEARRPLPGLLGLPGHLIRQLSPRGQTVFAVLGIALGAAGLWAVIAVVPDERAEAEQAARAEAGRREAERQERLRRVAVQMRPRFGVIGVGPRRGRPARERSRRRRMVVRLEAAIARDARARSRAGILDGRIRTVRCRPFPRTASRYSPERNVRRRRGRYECLAAVREFGPAEGSTGGALGYPFRARIDFPRSRYAFCQVALRAGEGGLTRLSGIRVPAACGG